MKLNIKCTGDYKPTKGSQFAAGLDLYNNEADVNWKDIGVFVEEQNVTSFFGPEQKITIDTQTYVEIPEGYVGLVVPRSGLGSQGLTLSNSVGVIDSDYRGPIKTVLEYNGKRPFSLKKGTRYAQLVIVPHFVYELNFVEEMEETERGEGGFGSTGID